jgi:hypothetical protein
VGGVQGGLPLLCWMLSCEFTHCTSYTF